MATPALPSSAQPPERVMVAANERAITIAGTTFVTSRGDGDIRDAHDGLFVDDMRHLSQMRLCIDGQPLGASSGELVTAAELCAEMNGTAETPIRLTRRRRVRPGGFDEDVVVRCRGDEGTTTITLTTAADFADIVALHSGKPTIEKRPGTGDAGTYRLTEGDRTTTIRLDPPPDSESDGELRWHQLLSRESPWLLRIEVRTETGQAQRRTPPPALADETFRVTSEPTTLAEGCAWSRFAFARLAISDPMTPGHQTVAAGAPWYMALFGRDSLISAWQARLFAPTLLADTLTALAARQADRTDPNNHEEPGKILHELRFSDANWLGAGTTRGARPYFGSIDATPLFLIMLGEAWRWGAPRETIENLAPAAHAAWKWLQTSPSSNDDGFLRYGTDSSTGLRNHGWMDSPDAITFADGRRAQGPMALVEVQGYAYRARRELAAVLAWLGDTTSASELVDEAAQLRDAIRQRFWIPRRGETPGYFAVALDGDNRLVDGIGSNMGHLLWCDVPSSDEAAEVARHLGSDQLASGWGLRTLGARMAGFDPQSYHRGSVWPHDTLITCEGLRRYGHDALAMRLAGDLTDALAAFDGQLPELYGGEPRGWAASPTPHPAACQPQAWAAGVPFGLATLALGITPDIPGGSVTFRPATPRGLTRLDLSDVPLADGRLSLTLAGNTVTVRASTDGLAVHIV